MSPELFKCYLLDLSEDLDKLININLPELNGIKLSHLLWADDLVLLALDGPSLQRLIDVINDYCIQWGLTVNISKTAVLIFNKSGRLLKESLGFKYGSITIPSAKEYCYLGITFTLSGSFTKTQDDLRKKGLRAYFSLKRLVDLKSLSIRSIFKLFDSLIVPVTSYGCSVWLHTTKLFKLISNGKISLNIKNSLRVISLDPLERLHIKFLKWTLLVHAKASNLACWGDSGRVPIVIQLAMQTLDYYKRLEQLDYYDTNCLVRHAFVEQRNLLLPWFNDTQNFVANLNITGETSSNVIRNKCIDAFKELWYNGVQQSSKLQFYGMIKETIGYETYLSLNNIRRRKAIAQLRFSSHRLNIETARYINNKSDVHLDKLTWKKCCKICCNKNAESLISLPFADPVIEDEHHVLVTCPKYEHIRQALSNNTKSVLVSWDKDQLANLFQSSHILEFSFYVEKILRLNSNSKM